MNYVDLINSFWEMIRERKLRCTPYEISIYLYLLSQWDKEGRNDEFELPTDDLCFYVGMSRKKVIEVRDKLVSYGLIKFTKGERNCKTPRYKLIGLDDRENEKAKFREKPKIRERAQEPQGELFGERKMAKTSGKREKEEFIPPSVDELEGYFADRGVEGAKEKAELFWNHYDSLGWRVASGAKIWRWDSLANKWLLNEKRKGKRDETNRRNDKEADGYKQVLQQRFEDADRKWKKENGVG